MHCSKRPRRLCSAGFNEIDHEKKVVTAQVGGDRDHNELLLCGNNELPNLPQCNL